MAKRLVRLNETAYQAGRREFQGHPDMADVTGWQCPYKAGCPEPDMRVAWLQGYYDALVDYLELKVRAKLGLPLINYASTPEPKKPIPANKAG